MNFAVTPAGSGQQNRALEDVLGVVPVPPHVQGLELTPEGEAGLDPLREGFLRLEESVDAMQAGQASDPIIFFSLPSRSPREFLRPSGSPPRLARFQADTPRHPVTSSRPTSTARFHRRPISTSRIRLADGPGDLEGGAAGPRECASPSPRREQKRPEASGAVDRLARHVAARRREPLHPRRQPRTGAGPPRWRGWGAPCCRWRSPKPPRLRAAALSPLPSRSLPSAPTGCSPPRAAMARQEGARAGGVIWQANRARTCLAAAPASGPPPWPWPHAL